jgi:hypothetical protein
MGSRRFLSEMRKTSGAPDALEAAIAIATAARRRQCRRETAHLIAPIVALVIGVTLACGFALCVVATALLDAGPIAIPRCTVFSACPEPF